MTLKQCLKPLFYLPLIVMFVYVQKVHSSDNYQIIEILESTIIGSKVHQFPKPEEKKEYSIYKFGDVDALEYFTITPNGELILKSQLQYVIGKHNTFFVIGILRNTDQKYGGQAYAVKILIKDANNHSPIFNRNLYHGFIEEGQPPGTIVSGLQDCYATDKDSSGIIDYTIVNNDNNKNDKFEVEFTEKSGIKFVVVKTKKKIDRDEMHSTPYLDLQIRANDGGVPGKDQKFETTVIRIKIKDLNDNYPVFLHKNWQASVQENAAVGTSILKISASDEDYGQNAEVYYYFKEPIDNFLIHPSTGVISVTKRLDYLSKNLYTMSVIAQDKGTTPLKDDTFVQIQILDVPNYPPNPVNGGQNTPPRFGKEKYSVTIRQDLPVKSTVFFEPAIDPDPYGPLSFMRYSLSGDTMYLFKLSSTSGVITLARSLQSIQDKTFELTLIVRDNVGDSHKTAVIINVQQLDQNLNSPEFSQKVVIIAIPQNIQLNSEIGFTAKATDKDFGEDGRISYNIIDGTGIGRFNIDSVSGKITTNILFKESNVYDLYVRAQDHGKYRRKGMLYIRITVETDLDGKPIFSYSMYKQSILEQMKPNSFIGAVFAKTVTTSISYSLNDPSSFPGISLNSETGVLTTIGNNPKPMFVEITAQVQGSTETSMAVMDVNVLKVNKNPPVFNRPLVTVNVAENSGDIPSLVCLLATDRDGDASEIRYSIKNGNGGSLFSVNEETGQLSVKNLDYESEKKHVIVVRATDGKHEAEASVTVLVTNTNDPPIFDQSKYVADVTENSAANTVIKSLDVTSESDNSHICTWGVDGVTPEVLSLFILVTEPKACVVKIKEGGALKWTKEKPNFRFTVKAVNKKNSNEQSRAVMQVNIQDTNDNKPVFSQSSYAVSLVGPVKSDQVMLKVSATDGDAGSNGIIFYSFNDVPDAKMFKLTSNGEILTKTNLQENKVYDLTVTAQDQGFPAPHKTSVRVLISVHAPNTELLRFSDGDTIKQVPENTPAGTNVLRVSGNGVNVEYSIVGGNFEGLFQIANNGKISLKKMLDYEKRQKNELVVRATENTGSTRKYSEKTYTIEVTDVNDNAPVFAVEKPDDQIKFFIDQHSLAGSIIYKAKAYDSDAGEFGRISYSIQNSNAPFTIDKDGIVSAVREISENIGETFQFKIQASDGTNSTILSCIAEVKSGQRPAVLQPNTYRATLGDFNPVGTMVTTLGTTNLGSNMTATYKITSGDPNNYFCIDQTKELIVQRSFDYDQLGSEKQFRLTIEMTYGHQTSKADVSVITSDENDNRPIFKEIPSVITVSEFMEAGKVIYRPTVVDSDGGENSRMTYSIVQVTSQSQDSNPFLINKQTGEISIKTTNTFRKPLDFETTDTYVIVIKAKDSGYPSRYALQEIQVKVQDENDEIPTFSETKYREVISRTATPGSTVLQVIATDLDSGANGEVKYYITGGENSDFFSIGRESGFITLLKPIGSSQDEFSLEIRAEDYLKLQSQTVVKIEVMTKEGPPKFVQPKYFFKKTENSQSNYIGKTDAISLDKLTYSIVKGNDFGIFSINQGTGEIFSLISLDAENSTNHILHVRATDFSERFSETSVSIDVINENDNQPTFRNSINGLIEAVVSRDVSVGSNIVKVDGYDLDVGDSVKYTINSGLALSYFDINDQDGIVKLLRSLKDFRGNEFEFEVVATDQSDSSTSVQVRVVLIQKQPGEIIRSVSEETSTSDQSIFKVGYKYPRGNFRIVYPAVNPFVVDSTTGSFRLREKLDYETQKEYTVYVEEKNMEDTQQYVTYELRVQVTDENDNSPVFINKNYYGKVNRNAQPETVVMKVEIEDADSGVAGQVELEIVPDVSPFSINQFKREIITTSQKLTDPWYNITIVARDRGNPPKSSSHIFYIQIGDNPPVFNKPVYLFTVSEDADPGVIIGQVSARSLSGYSIQYEIEIGNKKIFNIDTQGQLILQDSLDFESGATKYILTLVAEEYSQSPLRSRVNVVIKVENVNDNAPEFTQIEYKTSQPKSENLPVGETLLTVTATDKDCGEFGKCTGGLLTYSIENYKDTFEINSVTGAITNLVSLDFETKQEYRFPVKVVDYGDSPLSSYADVVIQLKNTNDNPPVFNPNSSRLSMTEAIQPGTVVMTIKADDADSDQLTYGLVSGSGGNFDITSSTGVIQVRENPNFRSSQYILNVSASDGVSKDYYTLTIDVEDVNDNTPIFQNCGTINAVIQENSRIGTSVAKVFATDSDRGRNGEIEYLLEEPRGFFSGASYFKIDNRTGLISTNHLFDRELRSSYIVLVIASDGGYGKLAAERNSVSCQLEIRVSDLNDHRPVFSNPRYDISIAENHPINDVILDVSAQDADEGSNAEVSYSIEQANLNPQFKIDQTTGQISVAQALNTQLYSFKVRASDRGEVPQYSSVTVDINVISSNPPRFEKNRLEAWVYEDVDTGTAVLTVRAFAQGNNTDPKIFYSLPLSNNPNVFNIDSNTGVIKTTKQLDYETRKQYFFNVVAKDERGMKSYAEVFINVKDINDNSPTFVLTNYEFGKVAENKPAGQFVEQVNGTDPDSGKAGEIVYSLVKSKESEMFTIDPFTGIIKTKVSFDREKTPKITFNVKATDQGDPRLYTTVYVTIQVTDANDNPPSFPERKYKKTVVEDLKVGSTVMEIYAKDADVGENAKLNYHIISGNDRGYFSMRSVHRVDGMSYGMIVVEKPLNREDIETFTLRIVASDSRHNAFTDVVIQVTDVNDNDPVFLKSLYYATVPENSGTGIFVGVVSATDKDTPEVQLPITYRLARETTKYFKIDKDTGEITTASMSFDRETKPVYTFLIFASDGVRTGSSRLRVRITDRNDERPQFLDGPYIRYVREHEEPGEKVGFVVAKDKDEGSNGLISYSLRTGTESFEIEPNTGLIRTKVKLDREGENNLFKVDVVATDKGSPSLNGEVEVTIIVTDANDQRPYFKLRNVHAKISECALIGTVVTKVHAYDKDLGQNAEVTYSIASGNTPRRFRIDANTGEISITHHLDYEQVSNYKLSISVRDQGLPQLIGDNATVTIDVKDCNDNAPRFTQTSYKITVREDTAVGTIILRVTAEDLDIGENGLFDFRINNPYENYQFTVENSPADTTVGIVKLAWPLDRENVKEHTLQLAAKDRGDSSRIGYAQLTVEVLDVNDNPPSFIPPDICGYVQEETTVDQTVAKIQITDPDAIIHQCPCTYELSDPYDKFKLEPDTSDTYRAVVKTKPGVKFDREERQLYTLTIQATDNGQLTSKTSIFIEVGDIDDNIPSSGGKMTILVNSYQGKFKNHQIGRVLLIDKDRGLNHTYRHKMDPKLNYFTIDNNGMISVKENGISAGRYKFDVVTEKPDQKLSIQSSIHIVVRDISDAVVRSGIPIRMTGLRKPLTCQETKYIDFAFILSRVLNVNKENVILFSINRVRSIWNTVDMWFSVVKEKNGNAGDVFMNYLDLLVLLNEKKSIIEQKTGARIISIGVDACAKEGCNKGFCYNEIQALPRYSLITDENGAVPAQTNAHTFVSIDVQVISRCKTGPKIIADCKLGISNPCRNGGVCTSLKPTGYKCACPASYEGPECQLTTRYVKDSGYFWLPPLSVFYHGYISFEFATRQQNGLILYHGPISDINRENPLDFLAVDIVNGRLRISISQGERKIFQKTLRSNKALTDGVFHHVRINKNGKHIKLVLDHCNDGEILEGFKQRSVQTREKCELEGTIPGRWKFLNGIYPLQIGGLRNYTLNYPDSRLVNVKPFKGCIRNIIDNGVMYDLRFPLLSYNSGTGCPALSTAFCLPCQHGYCDMTSLDFNTKKFPCICKHGWQGRLCDRRVRNYEYQHNSFTKYTVTKQPITWYDRYVTHYMVQIRTTKNGVILHEESTRDQASIVEYSTLEIINKKLQYRFNLGDGILTISLPDIDIADGAWHNITVERRGNMAILEVMTNGTLVGRVSDSKGTHRLLDTNGILYVGGYPENYSVNAKLVVADFEGCIADNRYKQQYLDRMEQGMDYTMNSFVEIFRRNVYRNCSCKAAAAVLCLNGAVCVAGSPPYCICYAGYTGPYCGVMSGVPIMGSPPAMGSNGMLILVVLVMGFLLVLIILALFLANFQKKSKPIPIYVDTDGTENIMPYNDEGAGEDDFQNFDLQKLLHHQGGKDLVFMDEFGGGAAGVGIGGTGGGTSAYSTATTLNSSSFVASSASGKGAAGSGETEPLLQAENVQQTEATKETSFTSSASLNKGSIARVRFQASAADDFDVAAFIKANLADADNDDMNHPRDTLLHYGYEGEGSDVSDLSDISGLDDIEEYEDFTFVRSFGEEFQEVNIIFNPEDLNEDYEV